MVVGVHTALRRVGHRTECQLSGAREPHTHLSQQHVASIAVHRGEDEGALAAVGHTKACDT